MGLKASSDNDPKLFTVEFNYDNILCVSHVAIEL